MTEKIHVLVVNEHKGEQTQYKQFLSGTNNSQSYQVSGVYSGKEALTKCQKGIDCVLLDAKLPDMDSLKFVETLRKKENSLTPVIIVTEQGHESVMVSAMKLGIHDYLIKPNFTSEHLSQLILSTIERTELLSKLKSQKAQLEQIAHLDHLTQLPNRLQFEETLKRDVAHARRHKHIFALLFIDLDNFKVVNDNFGHQVGDMLLVEVANILRNNLRADDFIARLGGDEFAVLITEVRESHNAGIVSKKLLQTLNDTFNLEGNNISVSASIGIADYPNSGKDPVSLLKNADIAMYRAKEAGRNNYQFYQAKTNVHHGKRLKIENALRLALKNEEFFLVYQPKFDMETNQMNGMEVLLRWENPELGSVSPVDFIPIAEKTGLIVSIGDWVIQTACEEYSEFLKETGYDEGRLAINISPRQLVSGDISQLILKVLSKTKIPLHRIEMELTETAIMGELGNEQEKLQKLHDNGVQIAIDDFGTGYSSLSHLKHLPISALKIDLTFVQGVKSENDSDAKIIKGIINLAKSLDLDVIAEGVETDTQRQFLLDNGCRNAQGFFFSKPMKMAALIQKLQEETKLAG